MKLRDVQREVEFRKCAADPVYFIESYCKVQDVDGLEPFKPFDYQRELLGEIEGLRRQRGRNRRRIGLLVLKGRQIGFSTLMGAVFAHQCLFVPHSKCYVGSKRGEEAEKILSEMSQEILANLPEWLLARAPRMLNDTTKLKRWSNGSEAKAFPADEPARGYTPTILVLDEWAFSPNPAKAWRAAINAVEHGGILIAGSSANGHGTLFHEQWLRATAGSSRFKPLFYGWQVHPRRDPETFLDEARKDAGAEWELQQEHPSEPDEAFAQSGRWIFNPATLDTQHVREGVPCAVATGTREIVPDRLGPLQVFEMPEAQRNYVIGADVAQGVSGGDYTCAQVLREDGIQVAVWHGHSDVDLFAEQLYALGEAYGRALIGVEMNFPGDGAARWLRNAGYPRLYRRRDHDRRTEEAGDKLGWHTNKQSKPLAVNQAVKDLREGDLKVRDAATLSEMRGFVAIGEGQAMRMEGKPHDDRVMALVIAVMMREYLLTDPRWSVEDPPPPEGTHAWWLAVDELRERRRSRGARHGRTSHMRTAAMR